MSEWVSESEYLKAHKIRKSLYAAVSLKKNDFSCRRNSPMSLSGWRILAGRLFQSHGPVAAKLRSPNRVLVRGTQHVSMSADRNRWRPAWEMSWQSLTRVINKIRCRCIMKCLLDQEGQLKVDSLSELEQMLLLMLPLLLAHSFYNFIKINP